MPRHPAASGPEGTAQPLDASELGCSRIERREFQAVGVVVAGRFQRIEDSRKRHVAGAGLMAAGHISQLDVTNSGANPSDRLQRVLAGIARHPNITGYVLIGLGCEVNQPERLVKEFHLGDLAPGRVSASSAWRIGRQ